MKYKWRNPTGFAIATYVLLAVETFIRCVLLAIAVWVLILLARVDPMALFDTPGFSSLIGIEAILLGLNQILYYVGALVTGLWSFRVSVNAHTLQRNMQYGPWGTIFWYVVPIAGLFMPMLVLAEIWDVSAGRGRGRGRGLGLIYVWWAVFIASGFVGLITLGMNFGGRVGVILSIINLSGVTLSAVLFAIIVRTITRMQTHSDVADVFGEAAPLADPGLVSAGPVPEVNPAFRRL